MKTVLVTGSAGFIGKNLCAQLELDQDVKVLTFDKDNTIDNLKDHLEIADFIFHLAGVNRPIDEKEFDTGNRGLTEEIITILKSKKKKTPLLMTSSIQAELDNPYGKSKKAAEEAIFSFAKNNKSKAYIYRLPNVFGKWCRPNYNSVVATFCYNISHDLPITISNPANEITLVYIDDIICDFIKALDGKIKPHPDGYCYINRTFKVTLNELREKIESFRDSRITLIMPNFESDINRFLYATYVSYLDNDNIKYKLNKNSDERGWLAEFIKSDQFGQIFISKTKPGITRGNHWHHTKIEKFLVIEGSAEIKFRKINSYEDVINYKVSDSELTVLDIPPGYTHSINNIGKKDLITLFWADEIFNKEKTDTYYKNV